MKLVTLGLFLLLPLVAHAQMPQGMNPEQMQQMMKQMQAVQACIQNIDRTEMKAFEQRARRMESKIKGLCAQDKRDEAQSVAMTFGMEIANSPSMQKMRKCGEPIKGFMPQIPMPGQEFSRDGQSPKHVCDGLD